MITSSTRPELISRIRHLAGPNPEGSKLLNVERLHLIALLGALIDGEVSGGRDETFQQRTARLIGDQLTARGFSASELDQLLSERPEFSAVTLADAIAVHPSLRHPYLD